MDRRTFVLPVAVVVLALLVATTFLVQQAKIDKVNDRLAALDSRLEKMEAPGAGGPPPTPESAAPPGASNVKARGAVGDGVADDSAAIQSTIDSLPSPAGGTVVLPPGSYKLTRGLQWGDKPIRLVGGGTGVQPAAGTRLVVPPGITAITMQNGTKGLGAYSAVENLHIVGTDLGPGDNNGIRLQCSHCRVVNVHVEGFGGANVYIASENPANVSVNANVWYLESLRTSNGKSHGLQLGGVDSNAGTAVNLDADANAGWGVYDNSFLGNTYLGAHFSGNGAGAIRIGDIARAKRFYGAYKETDGRTPVQFDAGGAGNNIVDFISNDEVPEFVDYTEGRNNEVKSPNR